MTNYYFIYYHVVIGHHTLVFYLARNMATLTVNTVRAKLSYFNFHALEVVSRYRDPQLQVCENYSYLVNLRATFTNLCV